MLKSNSRFLHDIVVVMYVLLFMFCTVVVSIHTATEVMVSTGSYVYSIMASAWVWFVGEYVKRKTAFAFAEWMRK